MTKDFTPEQADAWVLSEVKKLRTKELASIRIQSITNSANGFWKTPAGIDAGIKFPNSRAAQLKLVETLNWIYFTKN